jgi:hypothetical protein
MIDTEFKQILREMVQPAIEAARLSREATVTQAKSIAKKVTDTPIVSRPRCDDHREISFTLSTGQLFSACSATECWWSADPSAHEDGRYRKTHSDGQKRHTDIPFVEENDGQMVEVSSDDPVELSLEPQPVEPLEDVIDKPEPDGEVSESDISDEIVLEHEELEAA